MFSIQHFFEHLLLLDGHHKEFKTVATFDGGDGLFCYTQWLRNTFDTES